MPAQNDIRLCSTFRIFLLFHFFLFLTPSFLPPFTYKTSKLKKRYKRSRRMLGASRGVCVLHKESSHLRGSLLMKIKCCEFGKFFTAFFIVYILSDLFFSLTRSCGLHRRHRCLLLRIHRRRFRHDRRIQILYFSFH